MLIELERCRSGLTGRPGKSVYRKVPRVRIPPFPPKNEIAPQPCVIFVICGVFWTKFETISSKIQMIKTDSAGKNNLSGGMDSPCLGSFPARRRGLGRNAGGILNPFVFVAGIHILQKQKIARSFLLCKMHRRTQKWSCVCPTHPCAHNISFTP